MSGNDKKDKPMLQQVNFIEEDDDIQSYEDVTDTSASHSLFDEAIGHIEDIIVSEEFQQIQDSFLEQNCDTFEDNDENKLEYTVIHQEYITSLESYIENELMQRIPDFDMAAFAEQLQEKREELEGEVFEMLFTFTDFSAFKELMLDYQKSKESDCLDISLDFTVTALTPRSGGLAADDSSCPPPITAAGLQALDFGISGVGVPLPSQAVAEPSQSSRSNAPGANDAAPARSCGSDIEMMSPSSSLNTDCSGAK